MLNKALIIERLHNMDSESLALLIRNAFDKAGVPYEKKAGTIDFDGLIPADFEARDFTAILANTIPESIFDSESTIRYSFEPCATSTSKYDVSTNFAIVDYPMVA